MNKITVIGGGISGLTLAWWLHKAGRDVTVLESDSVVGGTMKSVRDGGWLIEQGPNSTLATTPLFDTLVKDLDLSKEVYPAKSSAKKRFIVRNGKLHALPTSPISFFSSELWSFGAKLQLLKEPFIARTDREETLAEFVTRRLGTEFLDYAVNPFVAGVYAGNPAELSVRDAFPKLYSLEKEFGSLILGAIKKKKPAGGSVAKNNAEMFTYREGMQTLPLALHRVLGNRVITDFRVKSIRSETNKKGFVIEGIEKGNVVERNSETVVLAVPSYIGTNFIKPLSAEASQALQDITYAPVAEIFLGYPSNATPDPLDGFGFLVPEKERRSILGAILSSAIFDGRAPADHHALTVFIGGSRQPHLVNESDESLTAMTVAELKTLMGLEGSPVYSRVIKWPRAIPQYHIGHGRIIERLEQTEAEIPGLYFSGNYRGGIAVGDCVMQSRKLADRIMAEEIMRYELFATQHVKNIAHG